MKDSSRHVVLGTQQFKPSEFAAQINLSLDNCWGIVRCIIDQVMAQKDGKVFSKTFRDFQSNKYLRVDFGLSVTGSRQSDLGNYSF